MHPFRPRSQLKALILILLIGITLTAAPFQAHAYDRQDLRRILVTSPGPQGPSHHLDMQELDAAVNRLARHAGNYPPRFDNAQQQQWAKDDAFRLSGMLDALGLSPRMSPPLLLLIGRANSVAYNLDVPQSGARADAAFKLLLAQEPGHVAGNHHYSVFLAGSGQPAKALPYALKAEQGHVPAASYTLGMIYLAMNRNEEAIRWLEKYKRSSPSDASVAKLLDAVKRTR